MDRREMMVLTGWGVAGYVSGTAFAAPACDGVSKDKAVRYAGLTIDYLKDILPLASQLGATELAQLINKAIPQLEKLKAALEKSDVPTAGNFFNTVTGILGQVANALLQLPESARRNMIMGIVTLVNITLRTVSLFVESETPTPAADPTAMVAGPSTAAAAIRKAFDATRF